MVFDENGIDLNNWEILLQNANEQSDLEAYVSVMIGKNLRNSIFIDNTANKSLPEYYERILTANISISTPNKVATSSSYKQYKSLKKI